MRPPGRMIIATGILISLGSLVRISISRKHPPPEPGGWSKWKSMSGSMRIRSKAPLSAMRRTASGMVMPWSSLDIMPDRSKGLLVWNHVSGRCSLNPERADSGRGSTVSPAASQMSALCTVLPPPHR